MSERSSSSSRDSSKPRDWRSPSKKRSRAGQERPDGSPAKKSKGGGTKADGTRTRGSKTGGTKGRGTRSRGSKARLSERRPLTDRPRRPNQGHEERGHEEPRAEPSEAFAALGLAPHLLRSLARAGYDEPTPIQTRAIPAILRGRDLLAAAQTGTGKTAAFAVPILQSLSPPGRRQAGRNTRLPRALILTPTRELAAQVEEAFRVYGSHCGVRSLAVFGGVGMQPQVKALRQGVDVIVATPGRLLDHLGSRIVDFSQLESLTLDEADRMLDMGFLPDIRRILDALPRRRQNLLFSATLPKEIRELARRFMNDPVSIQVAAPNSVAAPVLHRVHLIDHGDKRKLLERILGEEEDNQALVFCRTKHGADRLARALDRAGFSAAAIHGNKSQGARTAALSSFKSRRTTVLVATDIAARGLDIRQLPMVVNYDLPMVAEDYIHRIGRTGRAGRDGRAVSLVCAREQDQLTAIQKLLGEPIEIVRVPGFEQTESADAGPPPGRTPRGRSSGPRGGPPKSTRAGPGKNSRQDDARNRKRPASREGNSRTRTRSSRNGA